MSSQLSRIPSVWLTGSGPVLLIVSWLMLVVSGRLSAQNAPNFTWTPGLQQAYAELQKGKLQAAQQLLSRESAGNGVSIFLADYADMLMLVTSDDDQAFTRLSDREDERLNALKKLDDTSPWQRVMQAEVRLHWAFVKLKFGKEVSAGWDVIRAYKLLADNEKQFPGFLPTYKSLGTLHIMIGSVPTNYGWVANLLGLRGDVRLGQQELQRAQQDPTFRLEARLVTLLAKAYVLTFSVDDEQDLRQIINENPDNLLLHFFGATIEQKTGHSEQALAWLLAWPQQSGSAVSGTSAYVPLPIIDNILGDIYLQKGRYAPAAARYQQFLSRYKGQNFLKDSYYKLFLCHWLANDPATKSQPYLRKVTVVGRTTVESDKVAQRFAEAYLKRGGSANQKVLMQARLASDGGFLDSALAYLRPCHETSFSIVPEKAEYNYRLGRIYQRGNQVNKAIPYFIRALSLSESTSGEKESMSFGATSALQLGYIYQQKNDRDRARSFFQKALDSKQHEYKNSVDNKAKAGLNQLGKS